jgi:glycosyltransferase involved in cell wall biosynthesis
MKIALNAWFAHSVNTGSGQYTRNIIAGLQEVAAQQAFDIQIECVEPRARGDLAKVQFEQIDFPRAAQRMKADLAFVPYWGSPLHCAVPVVVTIHDVISLALKDHRGKLQHRAYSALVRAAAANAKHVLTDSEHSKRDIVQHLPVSAANITVVPLAAESRFHPAIPEAELDRVREKYNLPEKFALYLGSFDRRKNIETVMQVYVWAGETIGEECPLVLNGMPDQLAYTASGQRIRLQHMAQTLEIQDEVQFIGFVDEADKPAVLAAARVFLFPSTYEGFGLPVLEAMACGTPVIGSNASSIPEVVGNAGVLVDPMDARRMAGATIALVTEDAYHHKMRQRGLLQAAQFTWQRTALETLAVLRKSMRGEV